MPMANAQSNTPQGQWESICTFHGSNQIWLSDNPTNDGSKQGDFLSLESHCPLCLLSQSGIAPPTDFKVNDLQSTSTKIGQLEFNLVYLASSWSEPATGPPVQIS